MGQNSPLKPIALVVEDDVMQREMVAMLLEESEMGVVQCEKAEDAIQVIDKLGDAVSMVFVDVNLAGDMDGVELAHFAHARYPNIRLVVTSGYALTKNLPEGARFMAKPWMALDLLREAERARL